MSRASKSAIVSLVVACLLLGTSLVAAQQADQPVVVKSKNDFTTTVGKLKKAIEGAQLIVLFEANHKNMLAMVGMESKNSVTVLFARPQMGAMLMGAEPKAALEMPMRIAVRELEAGEVMLIYYQPSYLFSHYGNRKLDGIGKKMDGMIGQLVSAAVN